MLFKLFIIIVIPLHLFAKDVTHLYQVDSQNFKKSMIQNMKESLCKEDQNFLTCYQLSEEKCHKDVESLLDICFQKQINNKKINLALDSDQIVQSASLCLGKSYHQKNKKSFLKHKACREIY